ncbi:hypothetical protein D3C86_1858270 [compost metagenome]
MPVRDGTPGRPQVAYSLEQLAALVLDRTGHLDDSICRLRLALSGYLQPAEKFEADMKNLNSLGILRIVEDAEGNHVVVPEHAFGELPPDLYAKVRSLITQQHDNTRARRCASRLTRSNPVTTPEGTQP